MGNFTERESHKKTNLIPVTSLTRKLNTMSTSLIRGTFQSHICGEDGNESSELFVVLSNGFALQVV